MSVPSSTDSGEKSALPVRGKQLFLSVGDHSASIHATRVIGKLRQLESTLDIWGMGSQRMEDAGMRVEVDFEDYSTFGIASVVKYLPRLAALRKTLVDMIAERKPDAVLLIDYGGFHLSLAKLIKERLPSMPIVFLISPQVWGSRPWRVNTIGKVIDRMLVIFPFEETWYKARGINAKFVGHPLASRFDAIDYRKERQDFYQKYNLDETKPLVGIFPGSRRREIEDNAPPALQAISWLARDRPDVQFVISQANDKFSERLTELIIKYGPRSGSQLKVAHVGDSTDLMAASDIIWAKSGTTTLEAALMKKPMVIFYRADWPSYLLVLLFKRVRWIGLPNLLTGGVVPELFQLDCRAEQLVKYTRDWLEVPGARQSTVEKLGKIHEQLGSRRFDDQAAQEVLSVINGAGAKTSV